MSKKICISCGEPAQIVDYHLDLDVERRVDREDNVGGTPMKEGTLLPCGHDESCQSVLGHCRACDMEIEMIEGPKKLSVASSLPKRPDLPPGTFKEVSIYVTPVDNWQKTLNAAKDEARYSGPNTEVIAHNHGSDETCTKKCRVIEKSLD